MLDNVSKFCRLIAFEFFPRFCLICGEKLSTKISINLHYYCCETCSLETLKNTSIKLSESSYYLFKYENKTEDLLKKFKYAKQYRVANLIAEIFYINFRNHNILESVKLPKFDILCPVPSSNSSIKSKRFNHIKMLSHAISKKINLPLCISGLEAKFERQNQSKLNSKQRIKNVKNAFLANKDIVLGKNIILIDDIITTGATIKECKKTLLAAGASQVTSIAIAKREQYDF